MLLIVPTDAPFVLDPVDDVEVLAYDPNDDLTDAHLAADAAVVWGFGANSSNPHLASRGKLGVLISCGAAIITGAAVTLINFFWNVGQTVS